MYVIEQYFDKRGGYNNQGSNNMKVANKKLNKEITKGKRAEDALKESQQYTRGLIEASLDPLVTISSEGKITDVNHAMEMVTGYPREKLIGTDFPDYFTDPQKAYQCYQQAFGEKYVRDYPLEIKHRDGKTTPVVYNASVYRNTKGDVVGIFAAARDITEHKRAEDALRESEEKIAGIVSSITDHMSMMDEQHDIVWANDVAKRLFGPDVVGKKCYTAYHRRDKVCEPCIVEKTFTDGKIHEHETEVIKSDGNKMSFWCTASVAARYEDGRPKMVVETSRDITERKRAEKALEASNHDLTLAVGKLEEANRELKDFVYIASHDLREPLRKIYSFSEMLKDSLEEKLDGDDKENLEFMIDGASRMTTMIEGLLTYSRVGTKGKQFGTVDLNEVVEQLEQLELARLLEETGGTIEVPQPLPIVEADAVQMRQLLQNLIANGIKYRRKEVQPQIVISTENIDDDKVKIKVKDNGIGIDDKYHEDIFKMFRRLHSRQEYAGTGIGLAVCKRIVGKHNGQIGVESNPGEGTTFWFTLSPANEMAAVS
jgi:PAS domain S-box-containing protein